MGEPGRLERRDGLLDGAFVGRVEGGRIDGSRRGARDGVQQVARPGDAAHGFGGDRHGCGFCLSRPARRTGWEVARRTLARTREREQVSLPAGRRPAEAPRPGQPSAASADRLSSFGPPASRPWGPWCGRGDSNPHALASASPSSWCVCQFRHFRARVGAALSARPSAEPHVSRRASARSTPDSIRTGWGNQGSAPRAGPGLNRRSPAECFGGPLHTPRSRSDRGARPTPGPSLARRPEAGHAVPARPAAGLSAGDGRQAAAFTSMALGLACSLFGIRTVSTPSLNVASSRPSSTLSGSTNDRTKQP